MPTDATTHQPGMGPPGRRDVILRCCGPRPSRAASPALPMNSACTRTRFGFTSTRWLRAGRVEQVLGDSAGRGRPPILFRASRRMDPTGPTNYRLLAGILTGYVAGHPDAAAIAAQLGRSTSPALVASSAPHRAPSKTRAVTELVELLAELGFEPEPADGRRTREIRLRHCPFPELGRTTRRGDLLGAPGPDAGRAERDAGTGHRGSSRPVRRARLVRRAPGTRTDP